jgi:NAD(P)-dependent dehydrogenase (short-subunit alcohol dehydrogenase family)
MEINVKANLILSQAFLANSSEKPTFISVNTAGAHVPPIPVGLSSYAVSKFALIKLMDYFAAENPHVKVLQVHPGVLKTDMNKKSVDAGLELPYDDSESPLAY